MTPRSRQMLGALAIVLVLAGGYVLKFGLYPRYFDIQWDEEVQLHDGRVIVVHVKNTYERRGLRLTRFDNVIFRRNALTFEAGGAQGMLTFSSRLGVRSLDQIQGAWYVVLFGQGPYGNFPDEMPDHWGMDYTVTEERLARLDANQFKPISWSEAPNGALTKPNRIIGSMTNAVIAQLDGKKVTLADKRRLSEMYPPGPGALAISRPIRMNNTVKGEAK